jgi:hypothetical protein
LKDAPGTKTDDNETFGYPFATNVPSPLFFIFYFFFGLVVWMICKTSFTLYSWQAFRKDNSKGPNADRISVAPKAPLKKGDKLGTGLTTWAEEVAHEAQVRKESGHAGVGDGYTNFKQKNTQEEAALRKKLKQMEQRIRPDDQAYYIPATTFEGYKFDYIFTTRANYGTGYFWDGMDSLQKFQRGEGPTTTTKDDEDNGDKVEKHKTREKKLLTTNETTAEGGDVAAENGPKKKRKRKDKEMIKGPVILEDPNNPMEQVQAAIRRKLEERLMASGHHPLLPAGWEATTDPSSCQTYYFCRITGERRWDIPTQPATAVLSETPTTSETVPSASVTVSSNLPEGWSLAIDISTGKTYYYQTNGSGGQTWTIPTEPFRSGITTTVATTAATTTSPTNATITTIALPSGWQSAMDASSGKMYYFNAASGETRWEVPQG